MLNCGWKYICFIVQIEINPIKKNSESFIALKKMLLIIIDADGINEVCV